MDELKKLAIDMAQDGNDIAHDLDETLKLLMEHRSTGYKGLGYKSVNDGKGAQSVTIDFPSPAEAAKYKAMAEDGVAPGAEAAEGMEPEGAEMEPAAEPAQGKMPGQMVPGRMSASSNVVVKVAMDDEEDIRDGLKSKYPKKFLENIGLA